MNDQPKIIGPLLANVFQIAAAKQQELNQVWVRISTRIGGKLPNSELTAAIQRDGDLDLLLRCDEIRGIQSPDMFVLTRFDQMSTCWSGSLYETFRLLEDRELVDQDVRFSEIHNDLRLLRIPLEKHEIVRDRKEKQVQFTRYPPRNDSSDSYIYKRKDDQRAHIMLSGITSSGSITWLALDLESKSERWIEQRSLSDRIVELWRDA